MRKVVLFAALSAAVILWNADLASACGRRSSCGGSSSCSSGYSCGSSCYSYSSYSCGSSCYSGGYGHGCYSGGYSSGYSHCSTPSYGHSYTPSYGGSYCSGGSCGFASTGTSTLSTGTAYAAAPVVTTAPATLVVNVPTGAALTVDGAATSQKAASRTFTTPALEKGKEFVYTLAVQAEVDGKMETVTKKVTVKAGETTNVSFEMPTAVAKK